MSYGFQPSILWPLVQNEAPTNPTSVWEALESRNSKWVRRSPTRPAPCRLENQIAITADPARSLTCYSESGGRGGGYPPGGGGGGADRLYDLTTPGIWFPFAYMHC